MTNRERGAALLETALALPVMLFALYGVTWGVRVGAVSERIEGAVRYAGVIAAQQSPYNDYSFYALYNNLGGTATVKPQPCQTPPSTLITGGRMPAVTGAPAKNNVDAPFWQPDASSYRPNCLPSSGRVTVSGADLSRSYLMLMSAPIASASITDSLAAGPFSMPRAQFSTSSRFYRSPDLATLMHCEDQLSNPISLSLQPPLNGASTPVTAPLTNSDLNVSTIAASANCAAAPGAQATLPPQAPYSPAPGSTTSPSSATPPPATPTPVPTQAPTSTPQPNVTPTAGSTPTPGSGGSGGGSGGGTGGGTGGTPTPKPGNGGGGGGGGGGTPTAGPYTPAPTSTPKPPAPTVTPSTPKPTTTPNKTPTPTPKPSPTSNGTNS